MREIDPKIFGPGTWIVTHVLGLVNDQGGTPKHYEFYSTYVYRMCHALPCGECRKHAVRYLDRNPIPLKKSEGSMFEWSVKFHNVVNKRLKKPLISLEEARKIYENTEVVLNNKHTGDTCSINSCEDSPL